MADWIVAALLVAGGGFCLAAGIGVARMRDVYARMHAATKAGTLGLGLVCLAAMVRAERLSDVVEPLFVLVFMLATAPVGAHLIARAAFRGRVAEAPGTSADAEAEAFRAAPRGKGGA